MKAHLPSHRVSHDDLARENGFHSKEGVHKLIVAEQSKSLLTSCNLSQHRMSGCAQCAWWQISFPRPRRVRLIQNTRAQRRSVCQRHKLCWQILNSASSTFSVRGFECFVSGHHWLGAFYDALTTLYTPPLEKLCLLGWVPRCGMGRGVPIRGRVLHSVLDAGWLMSPCQHWLRLHTM